MLQFLAAIATILGGAAAAVQLSDRAADGARRHKLRVRRKRATVTPGEAIRAFRRQYPHTKVKPGIDADGRNVLVVRSGDPAPGEAFLGYPVIRAPEHW